MSFRLRQHSPYVPPRLLSRRLWSKERTFVAFAASISVFWSAALYAQTPPSLSVENIRQAHVYRLLFRQTLAYERLAGEAETTDAPKPYLRRILKNRLDLSDTDAANLLRIAQGYQTEVAPLRQAIAKEKAVVRSAFPFGVIPAGMSPKSPATLNDLHAQEDGLALRYRDMLRNAMTAENFQHLVTKLYASFAQSQPELE